MSSLFYGLIPVSELNKKMETYKENTINNVRAFIKKEMPRIVKEIDSASKKLHTSTSVRLFTKTFMSDSTLRALYKEELYAVFSPLGYGFGFRENENDNWTYLEIDWSGKPIDING